MEEIFYALLSTEEKIVYQMRRQERSTYWLARQTNKSQSYCYRVLSGKGERKIELNQDFLTLVNMALPGFDFTLNLLPHEQLDKEKEMAQNILPHK